MTKFLITGANGQVGYCLVQELKNRADILALDRQSLDISDRTLVFQRVEDFKPNVIINAAAYTAVDRAESDKVTAELVNVLGARNLAEAAAKNDALFIHISTDYVFDGSGLEPYQECDPTLPQGVYGQTKLEGEKAVLSVNPKSVILRTAWVFGEQGNNFVKTMLRLGRDRDELGIVGDQVGSPTYAGDIAKVLIEIAEQILRGKENAYGIYHFSGIPYVSWYEFAQQIFSEAIDQKILEKAPVVRCIRTQDYPTPAKRPANSRLDLKKIQQVFGIKPSDWKNALKNLKAY